jgi:hypothetical protein
VNEHVAAGPTRDFEVHGRNQRVGENQIIRGMTTDGGLRSDESERCAAVRPFDDHEAGDRFGRGRRLAFLHLGRGDSRALLS